jgi:hypothetical protein
MASGAIAQRSPRGAKKRGAKKRGRVAAAALEPVYG